MSYTSTDSNTDTHTDDR